MEKSCINFEKVKNLSVKFTKSLSQSQDKDKDLPIKVEKRIAEHKVDGETVSGGGGTKRRGSTGVVPSCGRRGKAGRTHRPRCT